MALAMMILVTVTASSDTNSSPSGLLRHLFKGTYVLYSNGRRSERDMPECSSEAEACNLAHRRYWFTPITERLCRCKDRSECPLQFTNLNDPLSQHVSNRAQLKFCGPVMEHMPQCREGEVALRMQYIERKNEPPYHSSTPPESRDTHTTLLCRCPWPYAWRLDNTTTSLALNKRVFHYKCHKLPQCSHGNRCGYIRKDTLETYYTCSCPQHHLCGLTRPQSTVITSQLHFHGPAYIGHCIPY